GGGVVGEIAGGPLGVVAVHVVEAPRIGLKRPSGHRAARRAGLAVVAGPPDAFEVFDAVATGVGGACARAGGVLPFGLGGQSVGLTGELAEPPAEQGRVAEIGPVGEFQPVAWAFVLRYHTVPLLAGDRRRAHPEPGLDFDLAP